MQRGMVGEGRFPPDVQAEKTYMNQVPAGQEGVMNRRTSSRRMNRIYGGGGSQSSINRAESNNQFPPAPTIGQVRGDSTSVSTGNGGLESLKSLPAGYDPIFNPKANTKFASNENSHIKIKPMRLSKGFE